MPICYNCVFGWAPLGGANTSQRQGLVEGSWVVRGKPFRGLEILALLLPLSLLLSCPEVRDSLPCVLHHDELLP